MASMMKMKELRVVVSSPVLYAVVGDGDLKWYGWCWDELYVVVRWAGLKGAVKWIGLPSPSTVSLMVGKMRGIAVRNHVMSV
eukprot:10997919-Prorocentrum_lima.AAC.1